MTVGASIAEKLAALTSGTTTEAAGVAASVATAATGVTHYVGGDVECVLTGAAALTYRDPKFGLVRVAASVGDTVLLTEQQADRLTGLGVAARQGASTPAAAPVPTEPPAGQENGTQGLDEGNPAPEPRDLTEDEVATLTGAKGDDVIAFLKDNPDTAAAVRVIEEARPDGARVGVTKALDAIEGTTDGTAGD